MLAAASATALILGQTPVVTKGISRAPAKGDPGSIYEQLDKDGNFIRKTQYGENGLPEYRQDFSGNPIFQSRKIDISILINTISNIMNQISQ